jgi:hypothetical protein
LKGVKFVALEVVVLWDQTKHEWRANSLLYKQTNSSPKST